MEFAEIKEIMQLFAKSKIQYLHIEREGFCFKMKQDMAGSVAPIAQQIESMAQPSVGSIPVTLPAEPSEIDLRPRTSTALAAGAEQPGVGEPDVLEDTG